MVDTTAATLLGILVFLLEQIYINVGFWYVVIVLYCIVLYYTVLYCIVLYQGICSTSWCRQKLECCHTSS